MSSPRLLLKTHVEAYTRKDGAFVAAHEDKRARRTLYHGSHEHIAQIKKQGIYGGLFASGNRDAAQSHGQIVHRIDLPEDEIMTQSQLEDVTDEELKAAAHWVDDEDLDRVRELVIDDEMADDDDARIMRADDAGEASWEAQRLRGVLAKRAGFKAVEMNDEHGTSYLVLPGVPIARDDDEPMAKSAPRLVLKSHIDAYTRKDGVFVGAHEDKRLKRHEVKAVAERVAASIKERGFAADVQHSGSKAGASSYIKVHDPETGRWVADSIRVSDHDKGAFNSQFHHHINAHDDVEPVTSKVLALAAEMRAQGKSPGLVAEDEREAKAVQIRLANARKKQAKGKPLTNSEREALIDAGELVKSVVLIKSHWRRPTEAQAEAGNYFKPRVRWNGLEIAIENPAGTVREGKGWRTKMVNDYGYVCGSEAVDGDEVDVYLGPNMAGAAKVYVVHQRKYGDWKAYDEDKAMLGFDSLEDAKAAYLKHYDDPRFLGPITAMPVDEFVQKVRATKDKPAMIKALLLVRKR